MDKGLGTRKRGKAVCMVSGGPDSATVAYYAVRRGYEVYGLAFNYGQIASKEVEHARMVADRLGIPLKVIDLSALREIFRGSTSLCDETIPMASSFEQSIIVPFRNGIFLSVAVAYADAIGAQTILYGAQASDSPFYPDCRRGFVKAFQRAARLGNERKIKIEAPFHNLEKHGVIQLGSRLGVPYELTWSCYLNGEKHCRKCESCVNRRNAFKEAGVEDQTEYAT